MADDSKGKSINWTERALMAIKVNERRDFTDPNEKGLVLRVTPSGSKTWALMYRRKSDGHKCRVTIGPFGGKQDEYTLRAARDEAAKLRAVIVDGGDPSADDRAFRNADTVTELLDLYISKHKRPTAKWTLECKRIFTKDAKPVIGSVKLPDLTRAHVRAVFGRVADRGATATVNRTLAALRSALAWAVRNDMLAVNPASGITTDIIEAPKDRTLSQDEIRAFWEGLETAPMGNRAKLALKLVLLTGQRPGEVCGALKAELDLNASKWTLPDTRTKNRKPHVVPLHPMAIESFREAVALDPDCPFVFCTKTRTGKGISTVKAMDGHALSHAMRDSLEALGLIDKPATPHDLRRTAATHMARLGIPAHHVGHVLNHGTQLRRTITERVYVQHEYLQEKTAALIAWGNELERIIGKGEAANNVVSLRA